MIPHKIKPIYGFSAFGAVQRNELIRREEARGGETAVCLSDGTIKRGGGLLGLPPEQTLPRYTLRFMSRCGVGVNVRVTNTETKTHTVTTHTHTHTPA